MSKTLENFTFLKFNLQSLVEELVETYGYRGEDLEGDPCFKDSEAGFEKCIWKKDKSLKIGYTVVFTFNRESEEIEVAIDSFTYDYEKEEDVYFKEEKLKFSLDTTLKEIHEELIKSIEIVLAKS